jgi:hypothetical protein
MEPDERVYLGAVVAVGARGWNVLTNEKRRQSPAFS